MTKTMNLKKDDRVKYTSNRFGDTEYNPLWGGMYGKIIGTVYSMSCKGGLRAGVKWDNDRQNSYGVEDLTLIEQEWNSEENR